MKCHRNVNVLGWLTTTLSIFVAIIGERPASAAKTTLVTHYNVSLDRWYSGTVDKGSSITFTFDYRVRANETKALRMQVVSQNATSVYPLHVVVREQKRVSSWEIPFYLEKTYPYWAVRRTLCPAKDFLDYLLGAIGNGTVPENQQVSIDITTQSETPVEYYFNIWFVAGFVLQTNELIDFRISPSAPAFFQYQMPEGINRVLVRTYSVEALKICSYISIQQAYCPIADLPQDITSQGEYQTFTTQGAVLVKREDFQNGKFDVVMVALSEDYRCKEIHDLVPQLQKDNIDIAIAIQRNLSGEWDDVTLFRNRAKHVYLIVENVLTPKQYAVATVSVLAFYALFYLVFRIALCAGYMTTKTVNVPERTRSLEVIDQFDAEKYAVELSSMDSKNGVLTEKSALTSGVDGDTKTKGKHDGLATTSDFPTGEETVGNRMQKGDDAIEETEAQSHLASPEGAERDKAAYRASLAGKALVCVAEVSLRPIVQMGKRDRAYNWTLLIIAVFYSLPVIQLVLTYQRVMESTGNLDLCYYNFKCAHPLGRLSDFNHIYSNIGYVLLGMLFILIVWKRQSAHCKHEQVMADSEDDTALGLPPQYGLFYAMGFSLIMEGIMSACYHICPNYSNFQFDTSFMYLLGGLFMLKMYQSRHADMSPNAQVAYAVFAFWIFLAVLGVVIDKQWFWTAFAVVLIFLSIPIGIQMYYMGSWKFDLGMFWRTCKLVSGKDSQWCVRPTALDRFGLLIMIFSVNWILAITGAIFAPTDFSTFLLGIVLINAFLYCLFYIGMKCRSRESISRISMFFMLLATATWAGAMYFFMFRLTNWVKTPADSREGNKHCFFLDFYDEHDVWHLMSACSMFFNFMILFTLDDDLFCVPRHQIRVF